MHSRRLVGAVLQQQPSLLAARSYHNSNHLSATRGFASSLAVSFGRANGTVFLRSFLRRGSPQLPRSSSFSTAPRAIGSLDRSPLGAATACKRRRRCASTMSSPAPPASAEGGGDVQVGRTVLSISGWKTCPFYTRAKETVAGLRHLVPNLEVEEHCFDTRDEYRSWWFEYRKQLGPRAAEHTSSPAVWLNGTDFIGGWDATSDYVKANYMSGAPISRPPRATHDNDLDKSSDSHGSLRGADAEGGSAAAHPYQYDLVVIGGGSGGLACSKAAAQHGAKVAMLDYVKPSPHGTKWGLGGTCVNVGCIPKKLMHLTAMLGESADDAREFGWNLNAERKVDWSTTVQKIQDYIRSLNFKYRVDLRSKGVEYHNALGRFVDAHTIELKDRRGETKQLTARRFVLAVGGRPRPLECEGGELAISSDDIFSLPHEPGKTLVIGASYVALECAGFLTSFGYDTTVMVRSILLRGFDQQIADGIGNYMEEHGTKFIRQSVPAKIEKLEDGRLRVTWTNRADGSEHSDVFDTVLSATGRYADTASLNLDSAGVVTTSSGKVPAIHEQTNVPHIYAIGDILEKGLELTPVAVQSGRLLADRIYGGSTEGMDYTKVATTVFTPLEYGCCGYSEEDALAKFGKDNIDIYHTYFTPLEWEIPEHRAKGACYAKIIVDLKDNDRIIGFHLLGPNAGEVTQGYATALRLGATYKSFVETVGIHPTSAEEFTTLNVTKSSGKSAEKTAC